jgi:hypothetical protein
MHQSMQLLACITFNFDFHLMGSNQFVSVGNTLCITCDSNLIFFYNFPLKIQICSQSASVYKRAKLHREMTFWHFSFACAFPRIPSNLN